MNRDGIYGDIFEDKKDNSVKGDAQGDKKLMAQLSKEEKFLLKEYDAAQQLTYHVDELRSKLTQFFLIFTGFATAALTLLVKGEAKTTVFEKPEGAVALLVLVAALLGSAFVSIIARLRHSQIEHFRITNNIRTYFLGKNYKAL